jgi:hypothetical protein
MKLVVAISDEQRELLSFFFLNSHTGYRHSALMAKDASRHSIRYRSAGDRYEPEQDEGQKQQVHWRWRIWAMLTGEVAVAEDALHGMEALGRLKGRLGDDAMLPESGNSLGDTWAVGDNVWVWITVPGTGRPTWVDP